MSSSHYDRDVALAFVGGFLCAIILAMMASVTFMRKSGAYGLGHWKLNAKMPLTTMWMNLGYWTDPNGDPVQDFEQACSGLLKEMLSMTDVLSPKASSSKDTRGLAIVDLGFGCGDQTCEIAHLAKQSGWDDFSYVGLTLDDSQVQSASRRVYRDVAERSMWPAESFSLFQADAARPNTWKPRTRQAVDGLSDGRFTSRWLLALDVLYHFQPSRKPAFTLAARDLDANMAAFDLLMSETATWRQRLAARAVGVMMGCPWFTFLTETQYCEQLAECGYEKESVKVREISEHVWPGVVRFLEDQDRALGQYGLSLGGHKLAGRLFSWFGQSGVLKAVVVVACTKEKSA